MLDYLGTTVVLELWEETLPYFLFWGSCVFQLFVLRVVDVVPSQLTAQWLQLFPVLPGFLPLPVLLWLIRAAL